MKKTIKSITKLSTQFHPAVGFTYNVVFTDNTEAEITDDEFLGEFEEYRKEGSDVRNLIGKQMFVL